MCVFQTRYLKHTFFIWPHEELNSLFIAIGNICCLIISASSFDPDQDRQNVGPDLDLNCLTL